MIKLDYSLQSPEERNELVKKILEENPNPSEKYLEILADYLVLCMEKQEKKEKKLLTDNRLVTVNKRETSFEGLVSQLENGEDGIYNLISNNKNTIFQPKNTITKKDVEEVPFLKQLREAIEIWEKQLKTAEGKAAYIIKSTIIELRKDQYIIKNAYKTPVTSPIVMSRYHHYIPLNEEISIDEEGNPVAKGVSLLNPEIISTILCNYTKFRLEVEGDYVRDLWYLLEDFDKLLSKSLADSPLYARLVQLKMQERTNQEIQIILEKEFGIKHSFEYISSLWRHKIPKIIATFAEDEYLNWYYTYVAKGKYKRCSRCKKIKLRCNRYFSKNKTSKDGFYSICKDCRNTK